MKTKSVWEETKTFFPLFIKKINDSFSTQGKVCIIGASDGKFVIPLVKKGWKVLAIEIDKIAVYGGEVEFPKTGLRKMLGLVQRLRIEKLEKQVEILNDDFLACKLPNLCIGVFTSCSWHYSINHKVPLKVFIERMQSMVAPGGIFCAEYMMPCENKHFIIEHYVKEGQLLQYFDEQWEILENFYTEPFDEKAHVGNLVDHKHQMGFFMAKKLKKV